MVVGEHALSGTAYCSLAFTKFEELLTLSAKVEHFFKLGNKSYPCLELGGKTEAW